MPADNEHDALDRWLNQQVRPLLPPSGTFELITKRARRRRVRKAVVSVASTAAVAAVVGIAVPVGMSLHPTTTSTSTSLEAGKAVSSSGATQSPLATGNKEAIQATSSGAASGTAHSGSPTAGYLPPDFQPSSATWDSLNTGWIIGPAGTPGHCDNANPDICTSVARTDDGGRTWHGLPAPDTGSPNGSTGVSGIRFLDGMNGWTFGPELWATHNGGKNWTKIATGSSRVTDLETAGNRAYALFAQCTGTSSVSFASGCTSYTLMTTTANSNQWTPAGGQTNGLTSKGAATSGMIALYGPTGYLAAPDGTLYSGPLGGTWQRAGPLPCPPGAPPQASGLPPEAQIALGSPTSLAAFCAGNTPRVYTSGNSGATWTQAASDWTGLTNHGSATSIAATSSGTVVLATNQGIYLLPAGAARWQATNVTGSQAPRGGFSYVGMTSSEQGVALPAATNLHAIWMTTDGGRTWQAHPIQS